MAVNNYCTAAEVKAAMPDVTWGSTYDTALGVLIAEVARAFDRLTNRKPGAYYVDTDVTQYFTGSGTDKLWIGELAAAPTSVAVAESGDIKTPTLTTWAATDYICWPYNALDEGHPYLRLDIDTLNGNKSIWYTYPKCIKIVGKFGYSAAVLPDVRRACIAMCVRALKRAQQAFQDTGAVVELGQLTYTQELDPEIALIVRHLRKLAV
jgi:hypothetical protein